MSYFYYYKSPLGRIILTSDGKYLTGLDFVKPSALNKNKQSKPLPIFKQTCHWLDIYFRGKEPKFTPPLKMQATPFRKQVWEILLKIPYGHTKTYGEIAREIARKNGLKKMSAQAVGGAVGNNPVALIIPCHRVIGTKGALTGYGAGLDKKIFLLKLEKCL